MDATTDYTAEEFRLPADETFDAQGVITVSYLSASPPISTSVVE